MWVNTVMHSTLGVSSILQSISHHYKSTENAQIDRCINGLRSEKCTNTPFEEMTVQIMTVGGLSDDGTEKCVFSVSSRQIVKYV